MIADFILKIPYFIVLLFLPTFVWEIWVDELRDQSKSIPPMTHRDSDLYKEIRLHNNKLKNSIKGRLVLTRWPTSVYFD